MQSFDVQACELYSAPRDMPLRTEGRGPQFSSFSSGYLPRHIAGEYPTPNDKKTHNFLSVIIFIILNSHSFETYTPGGLQQHNACSVHGTDRSNPIMPEFNCTLSPAPLEAWCDPSCHPHPGQWRSQEQRVALRLYPNVHVTCHSSGNLVYAESSEVQSQSPKLSMASCARRTAGSTFPMHGNALWLCPTYSLSERKDGT